MGEGTQLSNWSVLPVLAPATLTTGTTSSYNFIGLYTGRAQFHINLGAYTGSPTFTVNHCATSGGTYVALPSAPVFTPTGGTAQTGVIDFDADNNLGYVEVVVGGTVTSVPASITLIVANIQG